MSHTNQAAGPTEDVHCLHLDPARRTLFGAAAASPLTEILDALRVRTNGPGGLYNLGNTLGLAAGLGVAAWSVSGDQRVAGMAAAIGSYLAGSGSAVALTLATLIFFWGGEAYHRAWTDPQSPNPVLNRQGDFLSAAGALVLGLALALLGHPVMAATAGFLHAAGKLGSALHSVDGPALPFWPRTWPDPFRSVVLISRIPALLIAALALAEGLSGPEAPVVEPLALLLCTAIWAKADLMLFRPAPAEAS